MLQTRQIIIKGKVQGVFFRQSTVLEALKLGITGTVENTNDGDVRIIATGSPEALEQLIAWCHDGPQKAEVLSVNSREISLQKFDSFQIVR